MMPTTFVPLIVMLLLYFGIGFVTALNDILVQHFKDLFHLTNFLALLVQTAFFGDVFFVNVTAFKLDCGPNRV